MKDFILKYKIRLSLFVVIFLITLFSASNSLVFASGEFITTWKTDNPGTSTSNQITIPTNPSYTYNYNVDWGDSTTSSGVIGNIIHTYSVAGTYTVKISGTFPAIYFNDSGDKQKILSVEQWGTINWESMESAFYGASNLVINATDTPDLSDVSDMSFMFSGATSFNQNINSWNTSSIVNMSNLFSNTISNTTSFNQPLNSWNTSNVTDMSEMFSEAKSFNQNIGSWDFTNVTVFDEMFVGADRAFSTDVWDSLLKDLSLQNIPGNGKYMSSNGTYCNSGQYRQNLISLGWNIFDSGYGCLPSLTFTTTWKTDNPGTSTSNQITIPTNPSYTYNYNVDWGDSTTSSGVTGNITHTYTTAGTYTVKISGTFPAIYFNDSGDKQKILSVEQWGTINWESMESAFYGASNLIINAIDTPDLSGVTDMGSMFRGTSSFNQDINSWDVSNVTNMSHLFSNTTSFNQPLNSWDVSNTVDITDMFSGASSFNQPLNSWNISNNESIGYMFSGATSFDQDLSSWNITNIVEMESFLNGVTLSTDNYDNILAAWSLESVRPNQNFDAGNSKYCSSVTQRNYLINHYNWTIADGGLGCEYNLSYSAGLNGSITGSASQSIVYGQSGTAVTAVPNSGYQFSSWSDGSTANPRTDINVTGNISVTANFTLIPIGGGCVGIGCYNSSAPLLLLANTVVDNKDSKTPIISPFQFTRNMRLITVDPQVKKLQEYLNNNGFILSTKGPGSKGYETTKFGSATKKALMKFQKANKLTPDGIFGPITRKLINNLLLK